MEEEETDKFRVDKERSMTDRPSWDDYFLRIAELVSSRATCPRASVGVVIVRDNHILSTGYNGAASGEDHCIDVGCDITETGHCERAIHAEANAVGQAARYGINVQGAKLYEYDSRNRGRTCNACAQVVSAAGIKEVVFKEQDDPGLRVISYRPHDIISGGVPQSDREPTDTSQPTE
ncbi:hypothetical protein LCGC14_1259190 [marine sediment metagenome]|uniref:CMP/dCMP-type deaminase domain-containing protein n=1 Tax=marine sediment metagenome TaxID=412755 RepID=A0A0F9LMJ5_9ZZZZ